METNQNTYQETLNRFKSLHYNDNLINTRPHDYNGPAAYMDAGKDKTPEDRIMELEVALSKSIDLRELQAREINELRNRLRMIQLVVNAESL